MSTESTFFGYVSKQFLKLFYKSLIVYIYSNDMHEYVFDIFLRSTIQKGLLNMFHRTAGTLHSVPPMVMCPHMDTAPIQVTPVMGITTTAMWQTKEDTQHPEVLICKRREIETTNPLEISTQVINIYFFVYIMLDPYSIFRYIHLLLILYVYYIK